MDPLPALQRLQFVIVHNHFRPGGVRRVIELATPYLVQRLRPTITRVLVAAGEKPDANWSAEFERLLDPVPVLYATDDALRYVSEGLLPDSRTSRARLHAFFAQLLFKNWAGPNIVWAHNQGLGRNLLLAQAMAQLCASGGVPLVLHHHDWWFDNRWQRWTEMHRAGFTSLAKVAAAVLPHAPNVRHMAINQPDAAVLERYFPRQCGWLPNPASVTARSSTKRVRGARDWLREQLGSDAPIWLMPCRLLRRKNIAEALLLARWLRPEAWLVTTGAVTSPDEQPYAKGLRAAARAHGWPLRLSMLHEYQGHGPAMTDLLAASEVVMLTSLQEGFGLPYIEAAVAERPLIARRLPNIAPDLHAWGLRFPHAYDEVLVDASLFEWKAEAARQRALHRAWREQLPAGLRRVAGQPPLLADGAAAHPVPFSRLTLSAQLEVLANPPAVSFARCLPLNPWLLGWRNAAAEGTLRLASFPEKAVRKLSGEAFSRGFAKILRTCPEPMAAARASVEAQSEFIQAKLRTENLYPLTWSPNT
jgi:glycosyltransferase involved in cell wall biosynthesis